jgi:uncharacterized protein YdiU (UPF0061 family)
VRSLSEGSTARPRKPKERAKIRPKPAPYSAFQKIDGTHPFKDAAPGAYVDYPARRRHGGKVRFFNFALAKQMGLIPPHHPEKMTPALEQTLLDTFAITIINEYDQIHKTPIPKKDILPRKYMATRYLQLQHPSNKGTTSGDGRGIWNGQISHNGTTWDISSGGTGATSLCPATAIQGRFFKTGNDEASYGCGTAHVSEGISTALMSEIFHQNKIQTERILTVIEFQKNFSINVRAEKNLLRPSHFLSHLKQGNYELLKSIADYHIQHEKKNGTLQANSSIKHENDYEALLEKIAKDFGKACALYESEYIFIWIDWDGDNILMNGGIIDYGSIRQFGLYHHTYRYDDGDRWSTNIPEQKRKARHLVQSFAQIADFLKTGKKRNIHTFKNDPSLKLFDTTFEKETLALLARKIGFGPEDQEFLMEEKTALLKQFKSVFSSLERSSRSIKRNVADGVIRDALFCMRDVLREFPRRLSTSSSYFQRPIPFHDFMELMASSYASKDDKRETPYRKNQIDKFQSLYLQLVNCVAGKNSGKNIEEVLKEILMRSSVINRADRITGDGINLASNALLRKRHQLNFEEFQETFGVFIQKHNLLPERKKETQIKKLRSPTQLKLIQKMDELVKDYKESI